MTDATPSERRISAITETFWNLLRDCPPDEAVAGLEIVLARAREKAGMGRSNAGIFETLADEFEAEVTGNYESYPNAGWPDIVHNYGLTNDEAQTILVALRACAERNGETQRHDIVPENEPVQKMHEFRISIYREALIHAAAEVRARGSASYANHILSLIPAPAPPQSGERRETAWLIERNGTYAVGIGPGVDWSTDPWRGQRYPSEGAAEDGRHKIAFTTFRDQSRVVEHIFIYTSGREAEATPPPQSGEREVEAAEKAVRHALEWFAHPEHWCEEELSDGIYFSAEWKVGCDPREIAKHALVRLDALRERAGEA